MLTVHCLVELTDCNAPVSLKKHAYQYSSGRRLTGNHAAGPVLRRRHPADLRVRWLGVDDGDRMTVGCEPVSAGGRLRLVTNGPGEDAPDEDQKETLKKVMRLEQRKAYQ